MTEVPESKHKMGVVGAASYMVGNIIGSGIFITPTTILGYTNSVGLSLMVWATCAIIAITGSLCYIELGTSIRESGCDFAYICYVKWYPIAFAMMWVSVILTYPATAAIQAETFGEYLIEAIKPLLCHIDDDKVIYAQKLLGFALLWALTWLNFLSLSKYAARFQIVFTIAKLGSVLIIIGTGFYFLIFRGWTQNLQDLMGGSNFKPGDLVLAVYGGLWAYSGWDILNYGAEEIERPKRTMPLAILTGIGTVAAVYLTINLSYFVVLTPGEMINSTAVAATFSQKVLGDFQYAIPVLVGILLMGSINSSIFQGSRYMFAAARQGHLPSCFSCVNLESDSPRAAILAQTLLSFAISFVGDLDSLINYVTFAMWLQRVFSITGLLWIRYKKIPVHPEAIKMPIPLLVFFLLICLSLSIIPIVQDTDDTLIGLGIVASGLIFYVAFVWPTNTWRPLLWLNEKTTTLTSIALDGIPDLRKFENQPYANRVSPSDENGVTMDGLDDKKKF